MTKVYKDFIAIGQHPMMEKRARNKAFCLHLAARISDEREATDEYLEDEIAGGVEDNEGAALFRVCVDMTAVQKEQLYLKLGNEYSAERKNRERRL